MDNRLTALPARASILAGAQIIVMALSLWGCAENSSETCRLSPDKCNGPSGTLCDSDNDCNAGLHCCDDDKNCGAGMCTLRCGGNDDCPEDMRCEHKMCFYRCDDDDDCADTMSCEHDNTICEYE